MKTASNIIQFPAGGRAGFLATAEAQARKDHNELMADIFIAAVANAMKKMCPPEMETISKPNPTPERKPERKPIPVQYKNPVDVEEYGGFHVGQRVQVKEWAGKYEINSISVGHLVQIHLFKLKRDGSRSIYNNSTTIDNLLPLDATQPDKDKDGKTAYERAIEFFPVGGLAVTDFAHTTSESLVKIHSTTKTGRVKIQSITVLKGEQSAQIRRVNKETGRESVTADMECTEIDVQGLEYRVDNERLRMFTPRLYSGEWHWWSGEYRTLKPFRKNELTHLLD